MKQIRNQFIKSLFSSKANAVILFLLSLLSSFMYFFVQISVDGNKRMLHQKITDKFPLTGTEKELLISLQSNETLALSFLIVLSLIAGFVYYMFFKKYFITHKKDLGICLALGYSGRNISFLIFGISLVFISISYFLGLLLGWFFSDIMQNLYRDIYALNELKKGIELRSCLTGYIAGALLPVLSAIPIIGKSNQMDTANLLNEQGVIHTFKTGRYPHINAGFSLRIALRKPFQICISFLAVGLFLMLFIMSISLNQSSRSIYHSQTSGRNYQYDVVLRDYQTASEDEKKASRNLFVPATVRIGKKVISQSVMGIESETIFFLENRKGDRISKILANSAVVSTAMSELYGVKPGDELAVKIEDAIFLFHVTEIAQNAEYNTVYISKNTLENLLQLPRGSFNRIYTNDISEYSGEELLRVQSLSQRMKALEENNVSNRISAVICQILGGVIGCLLIYLTILLKFQEDTKSIGILNMMGYSPGKINKMFISIYQPILNIAFVLLILPAAYICKLIHRGLSLSTNDYIPFQLSISGVLAICFLLNFLYFLIRGMFSRKIWKIQNI